tara:strand:- start:530 stop:739 length:210 start_codon:yes stop_codon:yes gene_type:complete
MAKKMGAARITALIVLTGLGVYFALLAPALTMRWVYSPIGVLFLIAAVIVVVDFVRRRRTDSSAERANS